MIQIIFLHYSFLCTCLYSLFIPSPCFLLCSLLVSSSTTREVRCPSAYFFDACDCACVHSCPFNCSFLRYYLYIYACPSYCFFEGHTHLFFLSFMHLCVLYIFLTGTFICIFITYYFAFAFSCAA